MDVTKGACVPAPQRTARIEDDIWNPAQARAQTEGASLGALMRAAVQRYASGDLGRPGGGVGAPRCGGRGRCRDRPPGRGVTRADGC
jgi:hypothetical protein